MGETVKNINEENWREIIEQKEKPVFVMFSSPSCPNCTQMKPFFDQYAEDFKDKVLFGKINVMENQLIAIKYGVMGTPTFKFFCHGHPVSEIVGAVYPTLIKKTVEDGLKNGPNCVDKTTWINPEITGYS